MSSVKCLECGLIWPSKNKAGGRGDITPHKLAYVCITCSATFSKCKSLHEHEAAARHKPPQDFGPVMAAAQAAAVSRAACVASTAGPSHAPAREDDADSGGGRGVEAWYSCPVCYMEFETQDSLADHASSTLPCPACMACLDPFQTLDDHYWESDNHPKCRPCAFGFENETAFMAHKATCPIAPLPKKDKPNGKPASGGKQNGYRGPARTPFVKTTSFGTTSGSSATVSSVTTTSSGGGRSWSAPPRPPPAPSVVPQPARTVKVPAATQVFCSRPQVPFFCSKCSIQFSSDESLQKHFAESSSHMKCRTCGVAFEGLASWATHKKGCPPPGGPSTSAPAVAAVDSVPVVPQPEATAPADNLAAEPTAEVEHNAPLSPSSLLAVRMMLSYEEGGSTASASEHPSRTCSPGAIPPPNALSEPLTRTTASFTGVEQEPITSEDSPSVTVNGEASDPLAFDSSGEPEGTFKVAIDGRDEYEEIQWYDPAVRAKHARPGPGVLPPLLANMLHDPHHALYSVSAKARPSLSSSPPLAPTRDEVHSAIPHWNASFCPEHNGWVLLQSRESVVLPPLVREPQTPLPSPQRREGSGGPCVGRASGSQGRSGQANLTHHWHRYEKVVDAADLTPPYAHGELLLDMFLCCQCPATCLVSDVIPGMIPAELVDEFTRDKVGHPVGGKTPEATAVAAWETVLTIIDNRLWKDEKRSLPVGKPKFREKIGWNDRVERVFEVLGFRLATAWQANGNGLQELPVLQPPPIDPSTAEGRASRTTLLRAWVELSAWLAIYREENKEALKDYAATTLHVEVESERDLCEIGIGACTSQTPREVLPEHIVSETQLGPSWKALGMTPSTHSWEHLVFAYLAQCRCDPANTMVYFTHLVAIVDKMTDSDTDAGVSVVPAELRSFIEKERMQRGRFTMEEHATYARILGFGRDNNLGVELDGDVPVEDAFIAQAWRRARQRTWLTAADQAEKRAQLDDALRLVAEQRGSVALVKIWGEERGSGMAPETAYQLLGAPAEADETTLLEAYSMRIEDRPGQSERMREALGVVAELRDSERLREFLATGCDPEELASIEDVNEDPETPRSGLVEQQLRPRRIALHSHLGSRCEWKTTINWILRRRPPRVRKWSLSTAGRV
ncbi:hypothetical protein V8D89_008228 [Ganoderma adspersum]